MSQEFLIQNSWLIALAVGSGLMLLWPVLTKGGGTRVSVSEATRMINHRKAVLVDIRDGATVAHHGAMMNAKRVEIKELKDKADTLSKSKETPLIVVCQTGARAGAAATILKGAGYSDVFVLNGGVAAWKEAGMPVKKVDTADASAQTQAKGAAKSKPAAKTKAKV